MAEKAENREMQSKKMKNQQCGASWMLERGYVLHARRRI